MSWHGIGLISPNRRPIAGMDQMWFPSNLRPSALWTGTAGSGFAGSPPVDPVRTTAKPALRELVPPQRYSGAINFGVLAMANDGGSLDVNLGIEKVIFHYEGNSLEVTEPRWFTTMTLRGPRTYFGWWARLSASATGNADLYVEAVPRDPTMQNRVIGPLFVDPASSLYTHSVTVAPSQPEVAGSNYHSIDDAIAYVNGFGMASPNPLITITEPGLYDITRSTGTLMNAARGYLNITASVDGVFIGKPTFTTDAAARLQNGRYKLRLFGPRLTLDFTNITEVEGTTGDTGVNHWLDGITMTTTAPGGRTHAQRGVWTNRSTAVRSFPYATEVEIFEVRNPSRGWKLARGCNYRNIGGDVANQTRCFAFCTLDTHNNKPTNMEIDAFSVVYDGAEATATLAFPGGVHSSGGGGLFTLTIGSDEHTFDVGSAGNNEAYFLGTATFRGVSGLGGYWHQDVVDWLNTIPGVTAVRLIEEERAAAYSTLPAPFHSIAGGGFAAQNVKDTPLVVRSINNMHGDFYQDDTGSLENAMIAFNYGKKIEGQILFLSPSGGEQIERDVFVVGNALGVDLESSTYFNPDNAFSTLGRSTGGGLTASHVVIAHNTIGHQRWRIVNNTTTDAYCIFKNNVARGFQLPDAGLPANLTIDGLHIYGNQAPPSGATNLFRSGDRSTIYADYEAGDFSPAGPLLNEGVARALPFDRTRTPYPPFTALGAYAIAAPQFVPPVTATPLTDLLAMFNAIPGGRSEFYDLAAAIDTGPGINNETWTCAGQSQNNNQISRFGSLARRPVIAPDGALFGPVGSSQTNIGTPVVGGLYTVIMALTKAAEATSGTLISNNLGTIHVQFSNTSTTALPQAIWVDGLVTGTRQALFNALNDGLRHIVTVTDINVQSANELILGRNSGSFAGTIHKLVVIEQADFGMSVKMVQELAVEALNFSG
jgi:hypothetical protein